MEDFDRLCGIKILLCEDHPINAQIVKGVLEKQGMAVDLAENGREGVELFARSGVGEYAAVLMDVNMPVLDGLGAAREIRALGRADAASVPMIAMTADDAQQFVDDAYAAGMDAFTTKPIVPKQLFELLLKLMNER